MKSEDNELPLLIKGGGGGVAVTRPRYEKPQTPTTVLKSKTILMMILWEVAFP